MTLTTEVRTGRSFALDAFRGLAIGLMVLDHVVLLVDGPELIRATLTRFAMPMFFVLAGHLVSRPRWRWVGVAAIGLVLPVFVPWIDSPNVLWVWAVGALLVWWLREQGGMPPWLLAVVGLTVYANSWDLQPAGGYEALALWGLMGLGAMVPRTSFDFAGKLPGWVAAIGRRPVTWYVGHLVVLQVVVELVR